MLAKVVAPDRALKQAYFAHRRTAVAHRAWISCHGLSCPQAVVPSALSRLVGSCSQVENARPHGAAQTNDEVAIGLLYRVVFGFPSNRPSKPTAAHGERVLQPRRRHARHHFSSKTTASRWGVIV